jgi:hypothetical protein
MHERSDADDFERAILRSELDTAPPPGAESDVLRRVIAAVAPIPPSDGGPLAPVGPAAAGTLTKGAATLVTLGKGFALGIGVSAAAAVGSHYVVKSSARPDATPVSVPTWLGPHDSASPASTQARPPAEATSGDVRAAPETPGHAPSSLVTRLLIGDKTAPPHLSSDPEQTPAGSSVATFPETAAAASRLREEAALLRRARDELRAGALAAAFSTLEASRQRFTAPELSQEREALAIELLHRSGERVAAASRAREFLTRFPESPHAAAVRAFADDAGAR